MLYVHFAILALICQCTNRDGFVVPLGYAVCSAQFEHIEYPVLAESRSSFGHSWAGCDILPATIRSVAVGV